MTGNRQTVLFFAVAGLLCAGDMLHAQVPSSMNYQGRVVVQGTNFDGVARFKFKLINPEGTVAHWSNDGTGSGGAEPTNAVSLSVTKGLFSLRLGDTNLANMVALPPSVFTNGNVRLRVWLDSGTGFEQLYPDQVIGAVGYAMMSANVADGAVTPAKLAANTAAMFVRVENDPVYAASVAAAITAITTNNWWAAYRWGDHDQAGYLRGASNLADLANAAVARTNLGLGTLAVQDAANVAVTGGFLTNVTVAVKADGFNVGTNQLVVVSNCVGIGTVTPASKFEVVGGETPGAYIIKIYSGTNVVAWGRKK